MIITFNLGSEIIPALEKDEQNVTGNITGHYIIFNITSDLI